MTQELSPEGACIHLIHTSLELDELCENSLEAGGTRLRNIVIRSLEDESQAFQVRPNWFDRNIASRLCMCGKKVIPYDAESNLIYLERLIILASQCGHKALDVKLASPKQARALGQTFKDDVRHILSNLLSRMETIFANCPYKETARRANCEERMTTIRHIFDSIVNFPAISDSIAQLYVLPEPELSGEKNFRAERASFYKHLEEHLEQLNIERQYHTFDMAAFCEDVEKAFSCVRQKMQELRVEYSSTKFQKELDVVEYVIEQKLVRAARERLRALFDDFTSHLIREIKKPGNFADFCIKKNELQKQFCSLFCGEPDWNERLPHPKLKKEFAGRIEAAAHLFQEVQFERYRLFIERDIFPQAKRIFKEAEAQKDPTVLIQLKMEVDRNLAIFTGILATFNQEGSRANSAEVELIRQVHNMLEMTSRHLERRLKNWSKGTQQKDREGRNEVSNVSGNSIVVNGSQNVTINVSNGGSSFDLSSLLSSNILAKYGSTVLLTAVSSYFLGGLPLGYALATGVASATAPLAARGLVNGLLPSALASWVAPMADYATTLLVYYYGSKGVSMLQNWTAQPQSAQAAREAPVQPIPQANAGPKSAPVSHPAPVFEQKPQVAVSVNPALMPRQNIPLAIAPPPVLRPENVNQIAPVPLARANIQPKFAPAGWGGGITLISSIASLFQNRTEELRQPIEMTPPTPIVVPNPAKEDVPDILKLPDMKEIPGPHFTLPSSLEGDSSWFSANILPKVTSVAAKVTAGFGLLFLAKREVDPTRTTSFYV